MMVDGVGPVWAAAARNAAEMSTGPLGVAMMACNTPSIFSMI